MTIFLLLTIILTFIYILLLIAGIIGLIRLPSSVPHNKPIVSILIPSHNSQEYLPELIETLKDQTYPEALREIIFINDRSTDSTGEILQKAVKTIKNSSVINIREIPEGISPKKHALLHGINKARGKIILTTDSDTLLPPKWIETMAGFFDKDVSMVLGYAPYRTDGKYNTVFHKTVALEYFSLGSVAAASASLGFPLTSNGANLAFRKEEFFNIRGYGKSIKILSGDDDLLVQRFRKMAKGRIIFNPSRDSSVKNIPPADIKSFIRQRIRFSSKHLAYPLSAKILMGTIYLFYVSLFCLLVYTLFSLKLLPYLLWILAVKSIVEIIFLKKAQDILEDRNLIKYYIPTLIPHILYIVFIPIIAQIVSERW